VKTILLHQHRSSHFICEFFDGASRVGIGFQSDHFLRVFLLVLIAFFALTSACEVMYSIWCC